MGSCENVLIEQLYGLRWRCAELLRCHLLITILSISCVLVTGATLGNTL